MIRMRQSGKAHLFLRNSVVWNRLAATWGTCLGSLAFFRFWKERSKINDNCIPQNHLAAASGISPLGFKSSQGPKSNAAKPEMSRLQSQNEIFWWMCVCVRVCFHVLGHCTDQCARCEQAFPSSFRCSSPWLSDTWCQPQQ